MKELVETLVKALVKNPDAVSVTVVEKGSLEIYHAKSSSRRSSATAPAKADGPPAVPHNRRTAISERHLYIKSTNIALRTPRQSPELFCIYVSSGFFRRGSQLYAI